MPGENYNIDELLDEAFGVSGYNFGIPRFQSVEDLTHLGRPSYLRTPILYPIRFIGNIYKYYTDTGEISTKLVRDFVLPAVTLSSFSRGKNLTETQLTAGYGSVVEMYGFDNWEIDIRGLCLFDPIKILSITALKQHQRLLEFENLAEAVQVDSELYNKKGIHNIIIKKIAFDQLKGKPGVIPFRMTCISDTPQELIL